MKALLLLFLWPWWACAQSSRELVAAVLIAEAGGEGTNGLSAVAEVIRRRVELGEPSPASVVKRKGQFSVLNGVSPRSLWQRTVPHPLYLEAWRLAGVLYERPDSLPRQTQDADHFCHKGARPYWSKGHRPSLTIGNHDFYRLRRSP